MYQKERRYLPSDLRPALGSTCGETRSGWRPRNPGQQSSWSFRHLQAAIAVVGGQSLLRWVKVATVRKVTAFVLLALAAYAAWSALH